MPAAKFFYFREGEREVQEERWLQQPCNHIAPINNFVELVQFSGVFERVENERDQAEDVEMHGPGRGPAAQHHVKPDAQVN